VGESDVPLAVAAAVMDGGDWGVVLWRGRVIGFTASSPNCASRKRKRRARRVEGSGVRWGCGDLKRWDSWASCFSEGPWLWECCFDDSVLR
jgi:hypothetical protein